MIQPLAEPHAESLLGDRWLSVDGKALRGSRRGDRGALRVVAAVGHARRAVLRQRPSREGAEEADALALLRAVPLRGRAVPLDAGLFKRPQVRAIRAGGGDYLGVLKGNGPGVEAAVAEWLRDELSPPRSAAAARPRPPPAGRSIGALKSPARRPGPIDGPSAHGYDPPRQVARWSRVTRSKEG